MKNENKNCPLCRNGKWKEFTDGEFNFRHGRKTYTVPGLHHAVCEECGTRGYLPGQRAHNKYIVEQYQSGMEGYISPSDVLSVREKYCLSQVDAVKIFGGGTQAFSKWERGTASPAGPTARLLKLALEVPAAMRYLAERAGVELVHEREDEISISGPVLAMYTLKTKDSPNTPDANDTLSIEDEKQYEYN